MPPLRSFVATLWIFTKYVSAKSVFAHVVVGNTAAHTQSTWENDITLAKDVGIDAFALNGGYPDSNIPIQVANAFAAAEALGSDFKLFFSFDYLGGGSPWPATGDNSVASYLNQYKSSAAYFNFDGAPFASTFEGTGNIGDWAPGGAIRSAVGYVYFVPDWSSLGPGGIGGDLDNIEGFFSWDMWPDGASNETDANDKAWQNSTPGKTYMMGVSPWFFHSASGGTDWVWRGDDLWADRWAQTLDVDPDFVEYVVLLTCHDMTNICTGL
jgi:glucan endo-1,3-alpha-glucosidase